MVKDMTASIIIPALNEEVTIGNVLRSIPKENVLEIIVVDGGSIDRTARIAKELGAKVVLSTKSGYGNACYTGVLAAEGKIILFLDADGADDPRYIPDLIKPIINGEADMVLGSRLAGKMETGAMTVIQYFGNHLSAFLFRRLYHLPITDLAPLRALDRNKILSLDLHEMTYGFPTEVIALGARRGWRIKEIPVDYHARQGGKSKISGTFIGTMLASFSILRIILKYA